MHILHSEMIGLIAKVVPKFVRSKFLVEEKNCMKIPSVTFVDCTSEKSYSNQTTKNDKCRSKCKELLHEYSGDDRR